MADRAQSADLTTLPCVEIYLTTGHLHPMDAMVTTALTSTLKFAKTPSCIENV